MGLGSNRIAVAHLLTQLNSRWPSRVTRVLESLSCLLVIAGIVFPIFICPKLYKPPYGDAFITTAVIYCMVYGGVLLVEVIVIAALSGAYKPFPFVRARDRADGVKMKLAADSLISETRTSPELIGAIVDAQAAFAAKDSLDESLFDSALQLHLAQASPELIGAILDARSAFAANDRLDEIVFDPALQRNLAACTGPIELSETQKRALRHCLQEATWHITESIQSDGYKRSPDKGNTANNEVALAIVEFYARYPDNSALKTLNQLAGCDAASVSPKWRSVIGAARRISGVESLDDSPTMPTSQHDASVNYRPEHEISPVTGTEYTVTRAFNVREREDEGPHFFLELSDGSILLMAGQHLMDIGYSEDPGVEPVQFPNSHMIIRDGDIICTGEQIEYDMLPASFWDVWGNGHMPDMTVGTDVTFDELKRLGKRRRKP